MKAAPIRDRIDAALEKMRWQGMEVRSINLTEKDRAELGRAIRKEMRVRGKVHPCGYRDHIVRSGTKSIIWSTHGVGTTIPQRLSPRVAVQDTSTGRLAA